MTSLRYKLKNLYYILVKNDKYAIKFEDAYWKSNTYQLVKNHDLNGLTIKSIDIRKEKKQVKLLLSLNNDTDDEQEKFLSLNFNDVEDIFAVYNNSKIPRDQRFNFDNERPEIRFNQISYEDSSYYISEEDKAVLIWTIYIKADDLIVFFNFKNVEINNNESKIVNISEY